MEVKPAPVCLGKTLPVGPAEVDGCASEVRACNSIRSTGTKVPDVGHVPMGNLEDLLGGLLVLDHGIGVRNGTDHAVDEDSNRKGRYKREDLSL